VTRGRLRVALALLGAALLVPGALLAERALRGAAAEQAARHRAVAERVFDEMERALSDLVAREEERPVAAFEPGTPESLRELPADSFVLGYFQLSADGRVTAPLPARDAAALRAVESAFSAPATSEKKVDRAQEQKPGTTVALAKRETAALRALGYVEADAEIAAPAAPAASPKDAYDALQSLNRGAEERASRQRKVLAAPEASEPLREEGVVADMAAGAPPREIAPAPARVAIDPLVGRLADERHLVLYRSVFTGSAALRQGLVLDVEALGAHLRDRGLGADGLGAEVAFGRAGDATLAGEWVYRHRFAEPFDALGAALALAPLGGGGAGPIFALAALLALAVAGGLFAVHRMVTVALAYAERRGNFVAAVTHELRTPLTAIRMYAEMLRDGLVPSEAKRREYYGTITAESERLGRLIDNVLEFARLERGTREMRLAAGDAGAVVAEVAALLRPHAEREGFALRTEIEPALPPVRFERDALLQVLVNLVDNAIKYGRDAAVREVAIECRRSERGVAIAVRDRGPGVPSRHLARIFEPFHRGEDELTRTTQGTGLGLALVASLVERMGGAVRGANRPDGGFEVCVELPTGT
jgi:signal transduction histidine kinase